MTFHPPPLPVPMKTTLDLTARPTNKLLLECGPAGTDSYGTRELIIPVRHDWYLDLMPFSNGKRTVRLICRKEVLWLGHVSTLGEVVAIYELLSQKKWPGR